MNQSEQELLMQLYDGELPSERARLLHRRVQADSDWRGVFDGLSQVGDWVRVVALERTEVADDIADRVMQTLEDEGVGASVERRRPAVSWLRNPAAAGGMLAGAALAAAIALVVYSAGPQGDLSGPAARSASAVAPSTASEMLPTARAEGIFTDPLESGPDVAIEAVDFGARRGTIFMVGTGATSTPVVWVMDEPASSGGRMEPL